MQRRGFTLIEVLVASVVLTLGLLSALALFMQSQRMMMASVRFETAQRVLNYFEMVHPIPDPDQVTGDPLDDDLLNIEEERAEDLCDDLEIDQKWLLDTLASAGFEYNEALNKFW